MKKRRIRQTVTWVIGIAIVGLMLASVHAIFMLRNVYMLVKELPEK